MSTGMEHYREAEEHLQMAYMHRDAAPSASRVYQGLAQVHATLALAAAVAGLDAREGPAGGSTLGRSVADGHAWLEITDPPPGSRYTDG